ncbi:MAG: alanine/glycine:cation symporter family protein [Bdellovibrionales bacterium]
MKEIISSLVLLCLPSLALAGTDGVVDSFFGHLNHIVGSVIFFDVLFFIDGVSVPLAVAWLVVGAVFFTFKMGFINFTGVKHAIDVVRGNYVSKEKKQDDVGEITHFQALTAALSATVGLGNIAGVAVAISLGGPGATFWMIFAGLIGMASKFTECTLAQVYKTKRPDGRVLGGPMEYLSTGLKEKGHTKLGKVLSVVFAVLCIGGSFGGGGSFQVNQSLSAVKLSVPLFGEHPWLYGVLFSFFVGIVILGGIKRIASTAERIVPIMCGFYLLVSMYILLVHFTEVPAAIASIFTGAFTPEAGYGGFIGVLVVGFQRAAFSNEAGVGSAPIAHSAARSDHPVREGVVALLEPLIDTVIVCTVTALVIIITGAYNDPQYEAIRAAKEGAALTSEAFGSVVSWFPVILSLSVILFAFSTIISWSYYGERCWVFLFGDKYSMGYKVLLLVVLFCGAITSATNILEFGDLMILGMAFPNILGLYFLSGKVKESLKDYRDKYMS